MPRYTSAYSNLCVRFDEIALLLRLARTIATSQPIHIASMQINAVCRGGVVLLSSHIEGYVEELGAIAIDQIGARGIPKGQVSGAFRFHLSKDLIRAVKEASDPMKVSSNIDALLARDHHLWDTNPNFVGLISSDVFLSDFSNPNHLRIKSFFRRFGYSSYERDLAHRLAADYRPCRNMLDQVIHQRNKIAHGDAITTGTPTDLAQMHTLVRQYCREADAVVGNWFRSIGCPIR